MVSIKAAFSCDFGLTLGKLLDAAEAAGLLWTASCAPADFDTLSQTLYETGGAIEAYPINDGEQRLPIQTYGDFLNSGCVLYLAAKQPAHMQVFCKNRTLMRRLYDIFAASDADSLDILLDVDTNLTISHN